MLQKAVPEDFSRVMALYDAVKSVKAERGNTTWGDHYPTAQILTADIASQGLYLWVQENDLTAAVTLLGEDEEMGELTLPWQGKKPCYLSRLCIHPMVQNRHLGEETVRKAMHTARNLGYDCLRLCCNLKNPAAIRLYTRMGFHPLGEAKISGAPHYIYEWLL